MNQTIASLVAKYEAMSAQQRRNCNEAQTKNDFINPLFAELGWDMLNVRGDEVALETHVSGGRADYAFKLRDVTRFYLEAKRLGEDPFRSQFAEQVITYAYNKGVQWGVLCNFATLQVFNAQWETRDIGRARVLNLTWKDYAKPDSPLSLLTKEAFEEGRLEKHAILYGGLQPRVPVEKSLLQQLKQWREVLYTQIALYRPDLSLDQVDEAIQRLFNRLIFIRSCEDRRIEEPRLRAALNQWEQHGHKPELVEVLRDIFREFDVNYDSDLFSLALADQVFVEAVELKRILNGLYQPPRSLAKYDFSIIDADVLGSVYEQYLGHVAQVAKQRALIEQQRLPGIGPEPRPIELQAKRAKRKEQGIYYTPKWVVDYIVRQTVGAFLSENVYNAVLNMTILDPASGSGSFLIRAFDYVLEYHAKVRGKPPLQLDQMDRLPILTSNIYGVDLDHQAVEVARLNLLLRTVSRRELLPSLAQNVVQGNSLVEGSREELTPFFGSAWEKVHPLNWAREFPDVMGSGGFDVIVGNPPYVRIQSLPEDEREYYRKHYESAHGAFDIYVLFIEKALGLLKEGGRLGFITSGKFLKAEYGASLRKLLNEQATVEDMVDLSAHQVFVEATTYPIILVLRKGRREESLRYTLLSPTMEVNSPRTLIQVRETEGQFVKQEAILHGVWPPPSPRQKGVFEKLEQQGEPLSRFCEKIFVGLQTSADDVYILQVISEEVEGKLRVKSKATGKSCVLESGLLKPLLSGVDIKRYRRPTPHQVLLFPYHVENRVASLVSPTDFAENYPNTWAYLLENRGRLESRERGKMKHERWYAYVYPKNLGLHNYEKLAIPRLVYRLEAFHDEAGKFYLDNVDVNGVLAPHDGKYLLGLLNSRLLDFYFRQISVPFRGEYRSANRQFISPLPIKRISPGKADEKRGRDRLVAGVERMLELNSRLEAKGDIQDEDRAAIERDIRRADFEIDQVVYELYGVTEKEIATIQEFVQG